MKKNYETMNMTQLEEALKENVSQYNMTEDAMEQVKLAVEQKVIVDTYNELSLLTEYANFMKAEVPMVALAKQYYYDTISVRDNKHTEVVDGVKISSTVRVIKHKEDTKFKIDKFIEWAEDGNKEVAPDTNWRTKLEDARNDIINLWKKADASKGDTYGISIKKMKKALQDMIDALVFVEAPSGDNAIVANRDAAVFAIKTSHVRKDSKVDNKPNIGTQCLNKNTWAAMQLDILHGIVEKKQYYVLYGDEPMEDEVAAESEAEAETK